MLPHVSVNLDVSCTVGADMAAKGHIKANLKEDLPVKEKLQHHLGSPGLPTIHRLAQCIWDLEFV